MRLVCPNCAAKYEVADDAIPATGRDVQCANCGETWFQEPNPGAAEPDPPLRAAKSRIDGSMRSEIEDILRDEADRESRLREIDRQQGDTGGEPDDVPEVEPIDDPDAEPDDETHAPAPPSPAPDADDREAASPAAPEPDAHEAPDPAMAPAPVRPERPVPSRRTPRPGREPAPAQDPGPDRGGHGFREITPEPAPDVLTDTVDIGEIAATLDSDEDLDREQAPRPAPRRRRSNRIGFYLAILIFLLLLAAYALKPQLIAALPESEPYLDRYSDLVDQGRAWLADAAARLIKALQDLLAQYL